MRWKPLEGRKMPKWVNVVKNEFVPEGMAVILHGGEIVNIIRYAAERNSFPKMLSKAMR